LGEGFLWGIIGAFLPNLQRAKAASLVSANRNGSVGDATWLA